MMIISNANLSTKMFTNVMTSHVLSTKYEDRITPSLHNTASRLPALLSTPDKHGNGNVSDDFNRVVKKCLMLLSNARMQKQEIVRECSVDGHIFLSDATSTLKNTNVNQNELGGSLFNFKLFKNVMMAHTSLAQKFATHKHRNSSNNDPKRIIRRHLNCLF